MEILLGVVLVLHLLSWAFVLGSVAVSMREPRVPRGAVHAALTALVTGILLVLIGSLGLDKDYSEAKIGVKLVIALAINALLILADRRPEKATRGLLGAVAGLTAVNVTLAVLW